MTQQHETKEQQSWGREYNADYLGELPKDREPLHHVQGRLESACCDYVPHLDEYMCYTTAKDRGDATMHNRLLSKEEMILAMDAVRVGYYVTWPWEDED